MLIRDTINISEKIVTEEQIVKVFRWMDQENNGAVKVSTLFGLTVSQARERLADKRVETNSGQGLSVPTETDNTCAERKSLSDHKGLFSQTDHYHANTGYIDENLLSQSVLQDDEARARMKGEKKSLHRWSISPCTIAPRSRISDSNFAESFGSSYAIRITHIFWQK